MKVIISIFFLIFSIFSFSQNESFLKKVELHRLQQNKEKADTTHSPLKKEDIANFHGLNYFEADSMFCVNAKFKQKVGDVFDMATSSGQVRKYRKFGELKFKIQDHKLKLNVYQNMSLISNPIYKDYLFIPFTDNTNGVESYGGGRYIDFRIPNYKIVELDFNLCYNPYCAYNDGYSCPIPPKENYLDIEIRAGEKVFKTH